MTDTLSKIKETEQELSALYQRMDEDKKAVELDEYVLKGISDQFRDKEMPGTVSVTMNKPAVFSNAVVSILQSSKRQIVIEGLSDKQNHIIEQFLDDMLYTADQKLIRQKKPSTWAWSCFHVCNRGPVGLRFTYEEDGMPNILPLDMRWTPFRDGKSGLDWFANKSRRSADDIRAEYEPLGVDLSRLPVGKNLECRDYWDSEINEFWVGEAKIFDQENTYGEPPAVIQFPAVGTMFMDEGHLEHWAESIFYMARNLYTEWNRLMSIQQSMAIRVLKPPYVQQKQDPAAPADSYPDVAGSNTAYNQGERPELLEQKDLNQAFVRASASLSSALQEGSINDAELGNVMLDRTAVWLASQSEIRNRLLFPRTEALEQLSQQLYYMAIRFYGKVSFTSQSKLGKRGTDKTYTSEMLSDPETYTINVRYMSKNKQQEITNIAVANAAKDLYSEEDLHRYILQDEDVAGVLRRKRADEARRSSPIIFYHSQALALLDEAETKQGEEKKRLLVDAQVVADRMVEEIIKGKMAMNGLTQPQSAKTPEQTKGNSQALMALPGLLDSGGGGGRQPQGAMANAEGI